MMLDETDSLPVFRFAAELLCYAVLYHKPQAISRFSDFTTWVGSLQGTAIRKHTGSVSTCWTMRLQERSG